ncbi:MAG: phosphoribosylaminoimidazolesuccinocarboxamide synthase [Acidimicrobiales bacterium]
MAEPQDVLERTDLDERLPDLFGAPQRGKVRDVYRVDDQRLLMVATDRISAFDRVLGCVAHKGQVLTEVSNWWFAQLADIVPNHLLAAVDPNAVLVRACDTLPVEVVVRGYLTGVTSTSLWPRYRDGARELYGLVLPDGLAFDDPLPTPIITPTTKAAANQHDQPISAADIVSGGLVSAERWSEVEAVALALFRRGAELSAAAGLTLVDTKYEFGIDAGGRLTLIDEVHTPDSSRFWRNTDHQHLDKELLRRWYAERGYRGDGDPPPWPRDLAATLSDAYLELRQCLLGTQFQPAASPAGDRLAANAAAALQPLRHADGETRP